MKITLFSLLVLLSTNVWAASRLQCKVSEKVNAPLQMRSVDYNLAAPLMAPDYNARIDFNVRSLNITYGIVTFLSKVTSPGQQVILIVIKDDKTGALTTTDGHGFAATTYPTPNGELSVECAVK